MQELFFSASSLAKIYYDYTEWYGEDVADVIVPLPGTVSVPDL